MEPATFLLVAQCLNQLRYRVPRWKFGYKGYISSQWEPNFDLWGQLRMYLLDDYKLDKKMTYP